MRTLPASEPASGSVRPNAASRLPGAELRQPLLLLLVGPPEVDRHRPERGVGGHRDRDRGVDPGQLLDRERVGERVARRRRRTPPGRDAHQPELAHLRDELVGEGLGRGRAPRRGRDLVAGEVADGVAEQALLVVEVEVHARQSAAAPQPCLGRAVRASSTSSRTPKPVGAVADVLAADVPGGAGDVEVRPGGCRRRTPRGTSRRRSFPPSRFAAALVRSATVPLVSSLYSGCSGRRQSSSPMMSPAAVDLRRPVVVVGDQAGVGRAERDDDGAGQRRDVDDPLGALAVAPGERVGEDQAALGVGVVDLDRLAVELGDDVAGARSRCRSACSRRRGRP